MFGSKQRIVSILAATALAGTLFLLGCPAPALAGGEVLWRWVGMLDDLDDPCPAPAGPTPRNPISWSVQPTEIAGLRFCVYTAASGPVRDGGPSITPPPSGWVASPVPDSMIVQAMSDLSDAQWRNLETRFEFEAGALTLPREPANLPVRIALIDTTPSVPSPTFESSYHGETLGIFLHHFLCEDPSQSSTCIFAPSPQLALGFTEYDLEEPRSWNDQHGGYLGLLSELAFAIRAAVETQEAENLVLNLSVAWDDTLSQPASGETGLSAPERMVHAALEEAACAGILVIAAAGNRADALQPDGPLLPAGWEEEQVPAGCQAIGTDGQLLEYQPLVVAVGGVENDNLPLPVSRTGALPPLVAYGESAVTEGKVPGEQTETLSGTSVSTLVVSMAAAAVWYYFPDWQPAQVMQMLYDSAQPLSSAPDFSACAAGGQQSCARPEVRRVRLCEAVSQACADGAGCPPELLVNDLCPLPPVWLPPPPSLGLVYHAGNAPLSPPVSCPAGSYPAETYYFAPGHLPPPALPDFVCPTSQLGGIGAAPWVVPQPNSDPCPDCSLFQGPQGQETLFVEIPGAFEFDVCSMTLERCGSYHILNVQLSPGDKIEIQVPPITTCSVATLHFALVAEGTSCLLSGGSGLSGAVVFP